MTEKFTISKDVEERTAKMLRGVLPKTDLPEGITVVSPRGTKTAKKPFVVVTMKPTTEEALECYRSGTIKYETITFNPDEMAKKLSKEE